MSKFQVTPEAVAEVSGRLSGISGHIGELHGQLAGHAEAAHGTPVEGAVGSLMGHWAQMLPLYALSGDRLAGAVGGAAEGYRRSDGAVANAAAAGKGWPARP